MQQGFSFVLLLLLLLLLLLIFNIFDNLEASLYKAFALVETIVWLKKKNLLTGKHVKKR